jgi:tRNA 2-selenouridine synthase
MNLRILGGMTGSGKTDLLSLMKTKNYQVIDLEAIARHKGSAFGALGELPQVSTEHFENLLYTAFQKADPKKPVWLEDESHSIGKVFIPHELFLQMRSAPVFVLDVPRKLRAENLVHHYSKYDDDMLIKSMLKIERKMGGDNARQAVEAIKSKDYALAAELALQYYDKTYGYGLSRRDEIQKHMIPVESNQPEKKLSALENYLLKFEQD